MAGIPIGLAVDIVLAKGSWVSFQADYPWQSVANALGWPVKTPTKSYQGGFIPNDDENWAEGMMITLKEQV